MKFLAFVDYFKEPERIAHYRPAHRTYLQDQLRSGRLVIAGPFADGSGALFVYEADSESEASRLIANDPFAKASLFENVVIRPWTLVFASADQLPPTP